MRFITIIRIALRALRRNKLRTVLTMLGIIIGVGSVITIGSIGNGAKAQMEGQIASLGQNVILIFSGSMNRGGFNSGWGSSGTLTVEDADAIKRELSAVAGVSGEVSTFSQVAVGNQNWNTRVLGESADYIDLRQWPLADGANFTEADVRNSGKVAIIGKTTAKQLFGEGNAVGQSLRIKNVPFTVVGELSPKGLSVMGTDQDDVLIVPYTSAMKRITGSTTFRQINVQAASPGLLAEVQQQLTELLRQRHRIQPGRDDDFSIRGQQEIAEMATAQAKTMTYLLSAIASVSLFVGGIGVMNIMLVSVTERTREIGIRMAVGAKGKDILLQFLTEAITLSIIGGGIGIAIGIGLSQLAASSMSSQAITSYTAIGGAFACSTLVGIIFGFYPALKASRLDPIEALRYE